jgi:Asp-tRNA(Asn)/Glu-tRNA(Gln) amidotransferase A subunit family amidase
MKIVELPAPELRKMIGSKAISPIELTEACIARIEALDPYVNAMAATDFGAARRAAQAAEDAVMRGVPLGLLHGLPAGIKDLEATAGLLTTHGSPLYRDVVPADDNLLSRACGRQARSSSARLWCKLGRRARTRSCFGDLSELKEPPSKSRAK